MKRPNTYLSFELPTLHPMLKDVCIAADVVKVEASLCYIPFYLRDGLLHVDDDGTAPCGLEFILLGVHQRDGLTFRSHLGNWVLPFEQVRVEVQDDLLNYVKLPGETEATGPSKVETDNFFALLKDHERPGKVK